MLPSSAVFGLLAIARSRAGPFTSVDSDLSMIRMVGRDTDQFAFSDRHLGGSGTSQSLVITSCDTTTKFLSVQCPNLVNHEFVLP
jgi:hypothetical protein